MNEWQHADSRIPGEAPCLRSDDAVRPKSHPLLATNTRSQCPALHQSHGGDGMRVQRKDVLEVAPDGAGQTGTIIVRAKTKSILHMAGMLKAPKGKRVSVEEMNPWR